MHIDVNNAFLSWTAVYLLKQGSNKDIRKIVSVIGGDESKRHGIVLAKSPLAKKYGIVTAETLYQARKKYKGLEVYPPNFKWYEEESKAFLNIIKSYTPDIEQFSIDECFIDYTPVKNLYGDPVLFAHKLKDEIYNKLGFTVNIGIGNNKLCAKMASDFEKPNKIHTLFEDEVKNKMYPLKVEELLFVGKKSTEKLKKLGIYTIGELANAKTNELYKYFKNQTYDLINSARGIDDSPVVNQYDESKCISKSFTLERNLCTRNEAYDALKVLADSICTTLRTKNQYGLVVTVILKDRFFKTSSHQKKLTNATNNYNIILNQACFLFDEMWDMEPIRLIGLGISNLTNKTTHQISIFEDIKKIDEDDSIDKILDSIKDKYGNQVINKASFMKKKIK